MLLPILLSAIFAIYGAEGVNYYHDAYKSGEMEKNPYKYGLIGLFLTIDKEIDRGYEMCKPTFL